MSNSRTRSALWPKQPLLVGAVVVTALVTAWLFVPTMQGHLATMNSGSVDVTPTEYAVTDDDEHLSTTLQIQNPTGRDIVFTSSILHAHDGDVQLTDGTTTSFDEIRIPAGETVETTIQIGLDTERASQAKTAVESESVVLSGTVRAQIGDKDVSIPVRAEEGGR
ncbi:hypothetical protein [Haladaptatus cibarius]|uniref:hypothetical protein n=1 Tax=Haladaptatus cibarius TaxID=453847 RepID=UPI0006792116|nr:hypothetical protein [Haladaptatus cibarius]